PTSLSVNANYNRSFNQQRFRDVLEPGVDALQLPLLQQRNYLFNWQYALNYSITKSMRVNLTASNNNIVRNYFNLDRDPDSGIDPSLDLWDGFFDLGEPNRHAQQLQLNYELPLSKIPFLDFINAQYTYTSNFDWQRGGDALLEVSGENINIVQNANTHNITATMGMQRFYDFLGLKKRDGKAMAVQTPLRTDKAGNPPAGEGSGAQRASSKGFNAWLDVLTIVKRINLNYSEISGTVLPGYTASVAFIGTTRPS